MGSPLFPEVVVNGEVVPQAAIAAEAQNHPGPEGKPGLAWRKAASALAMRALLLQEAHKQGLHPEPRELGPQQFETDQDALVRELLEREIEAEAPSDEAVHGEWSRNPSKFRAPPIWEASHILCACDTSVQESREAALERAKRLTGLVISNPKSFASVAQQDSDCDSKTRGGSLGQLVPGGVAPEFEMALRALNDGDITKEPIETQHGCHVIRLDAYAKGAELPFDAVKEKLSEAMEKAAWAGAAAKFVDRLVGSAEISGAEIGSGRRPAQ